MDLDFNTLLSLKYKSNSQKIRAMSEEWFANNMFCPHCGCTKIAQFANNKPVADFFCDSCKSEYELKSNAKKIGSKITDGAYSTMIQRIESESNPDFFF